MTRHAIRIALALGVAAGLDLDFALAASPAERCRSVKNKEAGLYALCRQKAEATFSTTGDGGKRTAVLGRCTTKLQAKWGRAEAKATARGSSCPSMDDHAAIRDVIDAHTTSLATTLAGGSLPNCGADLGECTAELATCAADRAACTTALPGAQASFATCSASLDACSADRSAAQTDATACTTGLVACENQYAAVQVSVTECTDDLATCSADSATAEASLMACTDDREYCEDDLDGCLNDLTNCENYPKGQVLGTNQGLCYNAAGSTIACASTGQDGMYQAGLGPHYTDNGNGTITDERTGLTWEKLSDDGSIHDVDDWVVWTDAFTGKIASLNASSFGGHSDWRVPNLEELESLRRFGVYNPAVLSIFNTNCTASCTVLTCSCTKADNYWASTTRHSTPSQAWAVNFSDGRSNVFSKGTLRYVRAVRGG